MNPEAPALIEMEDVTVPFRRGNDVAVIEHVNWTVRAGEFWVIGGLQGSGTSDFMFMLAGITRPLHGRYRLLDYDMGRRFGDEFVPNRLRVGMVFEDARLLNHLTLTENVALPVCYHQNVSIEDASEWAGALLKETGAGELAAHRPSTVARSWRRRAGLARALSLRPEILLLENPLRGLDARNSAWWVGFLAQLAKGHALLAGVRPTVVLTTDTFFPWRRLATDFAVLEGKEMKVLGTSAPEDETALLRPLVPAEGI